jgi:hypothetical protein
VAVYVWNDLSPEDGCSLVPFSILAHSLSEVAKAVRAAVPGAQSKTTAQLLRNGRARKAAVDEHEPAASHPGVMFWRDNDGRWRTID